MPNGTYGGVRGTETKVGQKTFVSRPTRSPCEALARAIAEPDANLFAGRFAEQVMACSRAELRAFVMWFFVQVGAIYRARAVGCNFSSPRSLFAFSRCFSLLCAKGCVFCLWIIGIIVNFAD